MRVPPTLDPLFELGIIEEVVRPLMSGKEAQLYVVIAGGVERVAKVYKDANQRSFKQRSDYTDGRKVRNSRDRRAMNKRTRYGRAEDEAAWRSAEVDVIYRLRDAGVRVPSPYNFMEGVLVMDLVTDKDGQPAPRLGDLSFTPQAAREVYDQVLQEVVRMLCAGVVHGDLSDFNILMGADGPVVIDFPQAVDPASNSGARRLLMRDVDNLHRFLSRVTDHPCLPYAQEMWALFERSELTPQTQLRGQFRESRRKTNTRDVLGLIGEAQREEQRRRPAAGQGQGQGQGRGRGGGGRGGAARSGGGRGGGGRGSSAPVVEVLVRSGGRTHTVRQPQPQPQPQQVSGTAQPGASHAPTDAADPAQPPAKKRRRRRRRSGAARAASGPTAEPQAGRRR